MYLVSLKGFIPLQFRAVLNLLVYLELNLYVSRLISRDIQAFDLRICGNGSGLERRILGLVWMRPNGGKGIGNECASR